MQLIQVQTKICLLLCYFFPKSKSRSEEELKCRTVGIVTDNEKRMEPMRRNIIEFDNTLVTYGCSSHLLNLLGQYVTPPNILSQVNEVSKYFLNPCFLFTS